ncbi:peptide MFS transporter [Xanthocytophaga agilis]|uniref:Peptide MFS transporter n=1 Tax=Xanthocytophaga agilis TaxID=3048010 RepID=A0AAE3R1D3_9BACT|nr:peptide MFS transporter [Xanthocytophaga agilis]MDJ1499827.1 peptide MFS transporter [Xanthocytophaga agilis]
MALSSSGVATATGKEKFTHPSGLYVLFFTEMWERFSYYGMRAILILFMVAGPAKGGMGLADAEAGAIYGIYTSAVYFLSLPGGWIADNFLGQKKSIWYGGIIIMIGHIILAIPGSDGIFFLGLATVAIGTGLLKPNISSVVGELYPEGGARRDAGFSIFYMGINLGGAIGMLTVGYLGEKIGWHYGFGAAAVGMLLGIIIFRIFSEQYLKEYGLLKKQVKSEEIQIEKKSSNSLITIVMAIVSVLFLAILQWAGYINIFTATGLAQSMGIIIVSIALFYFIFIFVAGGLTGIEKKRLFVMFILFLSAAIFWAGYEQGGSTLNTFSQRYTDRDIVGWEMPASWLQGLQSIYVIMFAPIFAAVWLFLNKRNMNPSAPVKFGVGLVVLGVGFLFMVFASQIVITGAKASALYLIVAYLFSVLGELCVSPVGLSFFTKLAPQRYVSQLMGIWFVATSLGTLIAGLAAGVFDEKNVANMPTNFMYIVYFTAGFGLIILLFSKQIKKWMGGVE